MDFKRSTPVDYLHQHHKLTVLCWALEIVLLRHTLRCNRVVPLWNHLPTSVKISSLVDVLKARLDSF